MTLSIPKLLAIVQEAGQAIMDIYQRKDFEVEIKQDNSPLTLADKASHRIIFQQLQQAYPDIPVISEESKTIAYHTRRLWTRFWLVDPLDGTKEFIKRNGEFTVNIGLIEHRRPVLGVIYAPALDTLYFTENMQEAFKIEKGDQKQSIHINRHIEDGMVAVQSRSHSSEQEQQLFKRYGVKSYLEKGSSLKFCMVAEGKAHLYYRHGPTWEWDTAAGHAIVEAAGGTVTSRGSPLLYNKETLKNDSFLVKSF
jgi:3'(2'), 5'-bisphosphate nucleotidase